VDAPVPQEPAALARRGVDREAAEALFDRLRFGPLTRARLRQLAP